MLKLLIGELEPSQGIIQRNPRLRIAYFSQHHVDALEFNDNPLLSPLEFLTAKFPGFKDEEYRGTLGRFGLSGNTATQPIRTLSGGQKSRVIFALMGT